MQNIRLSWIYCLGIIFTSLVGKAETAAESDFFIPQTLQLEVGYANYSGEIADFFADDFSYRIASFHQAYAFGQVVSQLSWTCLLSDDVRASSRLKMITLGLGLAKNHDIFPWLQLVGLLYPEIRYWDISHTMSDSYPTKDSGWLLGLGTALEAHLHLTSAYSFSLSLEAHLPQLHGYSYYLQINLGVLYDL